MPRTTNPTSTSVPPSIPSHLVILLNFVKKERGQGLISQMSSRRTFSEKAISLRISTSWGITVFSISRPRGHQSARIERAQGQSTTISLLLFLFLSLSELISSSSVSSSSPSPMQFAIDSIPPSLPPSVEWRSMCLSVTSLCLAASVLTSPHPLLADLTDWLTNAVGREGGEGKEEGRRERCDLLSLCPNPLLLLGVGYSEPDKQTK